MPNNGEKDKEKDKEASSKAEGAPPTQTSGNTVYTPIEGETEAEWKNKKEQIKDEKKLEKKKEKEERKKKKEEERQKEREERLKEKEEKRNAEKKRELRKEQRRSWLRQTGGAVVPPDSSSPHGNDPSLSSEGAADGKEKRLPKLALSPEMLRRQRELEQFLLNMPVKRMRGTTWKYYDIAPASGYTETMIVLPGGGVRPEVMYEHILGLAQGYRVVAPWYPEVFNEIDDYIAGVFLLMRHENIKKSHFFGLGFGAVVAIHFLFRHPGRVLSCSLMHCSLPAESKIRHVEKALKKMDVTIGPIRRLMAGPAVKAKDIEEHVVDLTGGEKELWMRNFKNFVDTKAAIFSRLEALLDYYSHFAYARADFERWEGKMFLLESEDDEYFDPDNFAALKQLFPHATVYCFSRCGHLLSLIRGKSVVDLILRFSLDEETYNDVTAKTDGEGSPRNGHSENDLLEKPDSEVFESPAPDHPPPKKAKRKNSNAPPALAEKVE